MIEPDSWMSSARSHLRSNPLASTVCLKTPSYMSRHISRSFPLPMGVITKHVSISTPVEVYLASGPIRAFDFVSKCYKKTAI
jgi:hypothetical protein